MEVKMQIGKKEYQIDGQNKSFDIPPMIQEGRTMLELRDLLINVLGVKAEDIAFDNITKTITFIR
jgi:hypothetical protein